MTKRLPEVERRVGRRERDFGRDGVGAPPLYFSQRSQVEGKRSAIVRLSGQRPAELVDALRIEVANVDMRTRGGLPREGYDVMALEGWIDVGGGRVRMRKIMVGYICRGRQFGHTVMAFHRL